MSESDKQPSEPIELPPIEPLKVAADPEPITEAKLNRISDELGMIQTCFPENLKPEFEGRSHFPESYYTLNAKERLLLVFAENFRRQFKEKYPLRRPVVLAVRNECGVQKFVSTTIRPTAFLYPELIGSWQGCASFVADHIVYEPLPNPLVLPNRLLSPETILTRRKANCFEFATLLCSFLTGTGYAACVVSGYAKREVCLNDLSYQECPIKVSGDDNDVAEPIRSPKKYDLKKPVDLRSQYEVELANKKAENVLQTQLKADAEELARIEELEMPPPDEYDGHRVHAWVVVIERALWCYKPEYRQKTAGENQDEPKPSVFFIEPATGLRFEATNTNYQKIDSIWNQHNYYVNCQTDVGIADMEWDLRDTTKWEHLLPGEPLEMRVDRVMDIDQDKTTDEEVLAKEKHLEMPISWVNQLDVALPVFEERFPGGHKKVHYKKAVLEVYAPYTNTTGLWREVTFFETVAFQKPQRRYRWFKNRCDNLVQVKTDFAKLQKHQLFAIGRPDALKKYSYAMHDRLKFSLEFYHEPRADALRRIEIGATTMQETYAKRDDFLNFREFRFEVQVSEGKNRKVLKNIVEKFDRDPTINADEDIYIRRFCLNEDTIKLQFHYGDDNIVPYIREFKKPPKSKLPDDIMFDPSSTSLHPIDVDYKLQERFVKAMRGLYQAEHQVVAKDSVEQMIADESDDKEVFVIEETREELVKDYSARKDPTQLELYLLKDQQLKAETKAVAAFASRCEEIDKLVELRQNEMESSQLQFSMFDPLRNGEARKTRMDRYAQIKAREELAKKQLPDFLAPYLCRTKSETLTAEQAKASYEGCLKDLKANYSDLVQELQRRHDESVAEGEALMRFLQRFQDKLNDEDYQSFVNEGVNIERNTRVLAQRIANTKQDATRKYEALKESLLLDARLAPHRVILLDVAD